MGYRRKLVSAALLAGAGLLLLAWVAQAQQEPQTRSHSAAVPMAGHGVDAEPPRGNDPAEEFPNASSADPSPPCFPARWHRVLWRRDTADPMGTSIVPRTALVLGVLLILILHLSALIVWPVAAIIRRAGPRSDVAAPRVGYPRLTAGAVITLSVGFRWWVRASHDIILALLTLRLPPIGPDGLAGSWRETWWTGLGRVHYSFVAITLAWYPFHLFALGFFF